MVYQWREVLDEHRRKNGGDARIMLTESYSPLNIIQQYFGMFSTILPCTRHHLIINATSFFIRQRNSQWISCPIQFSITVSIVERIKCC